MKELHDIYTSLYKIAHLPTEEEREREAKRFIRTHILTLGIEHQFDREMLLLARNSSGIIENALRNCHLELGDKILKNGLSIIEEVVPDEKERYPRLTKRVTLLLLKP